LEENREIFGGIDGITRYLNRLNVPEPTEVAISYGKMEESRVRFELDFEEPVLLPKSITNLKCGTSKSYL
jgi:hypothetical protein